MTALDATGLFALEEVAKTLQSSKRALIVCGAREQPAKLIHQAEFAVLDLIGTRSAPSETPVRVGAERRPIKAEVGKSAQPPMG
jgi:hypothetical protein